jgi:hypothetical protein
MSGRRAIVVGALLALLAGWTALLGWPDIGGTIAFLSGRAVTRAAQFAFVGVLCWVAIAAAVGVAVAGARRPGRQPSTGARTRLALAVLALGITLLGLGIARAATGYRVCCATPGTVHQAERLVR